MIGNGPTGPVNWRPIEHAAAGPELCPCLRVSLALTRQIIAQNARSYDSTEGGEEILQLLLSHRLGNAAHVQIGSFD